MLDSAEAGANTSRAAVIHARTLEVLDSIGVTDRLLAEGVVVPVFTVRDRSSGWHVLTSALWTPYPFTLMLPQSHTEQILERRLTELGGQLHRAHTVTGLTTTTDGASVTVIGPQGTPASVAARFVVGADGMHSVVREAVGIDFPGGNYAQAFVLADVRMTWPLPDNEVQLFFSPMVLSWSHRCPTGGTGSAPPSITPPKLLLWKTSRRCWTAGDLRRALEWTAFCGVHAFMSITASLPPTAADQSSSPATPHTYTARPEAKE